jgi:hypothetical protein
VVPRVVLVDKAMFGRDKACGDLVGTRASALLDVVRSGPAAAVGRREDVMGLLRHERGERTLTMVCTSPACALTPGCARCTPPSPRRRTGDRPGGRRAGRDVELDLTNVNSAAQVIVEGIRRLEDRFV